MHISEGDNYACITILTDNYVNHIKGNIFGPIRISHDYKYLLSLFGVQNLVNLVSKLT